MKQKRQPQPDSAKKKTFEKRELFLRNYVGITDGKQSKRNETLVKSKINCEKYTMNNNLYGKLEIFF